MAVEQPDARIIALEAQHEVAIRADDDGVAAHGHGRELGGRDARVGKGPRVVVGAPDGLEVVPVQVEGVLARVEVVDDDVDDLVLLQDERVRVGAVDGWVGGVLARAEDGVEGGDLGGDVGDVVEEGAGGC